MITRPICAALVLAAVASAQSDPPPWYEGAKLIANDAQLNQNFGVSVSSSGKRILVGAEGDVGFRGAAYVFVFAEGVWREEAKLVASDGAGADRFGTAVSLDGDRALIGARYNEFPRGAAYVFARTDAGWVEEAKLTPNDTMGFFGRSVSLDGDRAMIGSFERGAYIFVRTDSGWVEEAKVGGFGDQQGWAVSISGERALLSARGDGELGYEAGAVLVFKRTDAGWKQEAKLLADDGATSDYFGSSVSLHGDLAVIGSPYTDTTILNGGAAYVFERSGSSWNQKAKLEAGDPILWGLLGDAVSTDGVRILVGSARATSLEGAAYVFRRRGSSWREETKLEASDGTTYARFGASVCINGDLAAVGANFADAPGIFSAGAAYVNVGPTPARSMLRNAGSNPVSFFADDPVLGSTWSARIDPTATGHRRALLLIGAPAEARVLRSGYALLVGDALVRAAPVPGSASWTARIPREPTLAGLTLSAQVAHFAGPTPFALSNARDLAFGY